MTRRSRAASPRLRECVCGRVVRSSAFAHHARACGRFLAHYRRYALHVLRRMGIV